ncbi:ABC transporter permease [Brevibacterium sp. FAM 25378]|uniref:ABC transporter permease n=1 Tax=unclassified Brevibacterium TaxID=2614124 RepID=UPI0010922167|nr:ABC transporter permease [Brevibacterium sp. S22]TGD26990.1 ABC transporter permease [Brevibacterium sp. S22]
MTEQFVDQRELTGADANRSVWASLRSRPLFWICAVALGLLAVIAIMPGTLAGLLSTSDPRACELSLSVKPPSAAHPFGTDIQGCDILANVFYGARTSLLIGFVATALCAIVALVLGTSAGYYGGLADRIISRLTDVFLGFPFLLGAIVVLNSVATRSALIVALVLALFTWPTLARLVRSSVRSVRESEFVHAASAVGMTDGRILREHVVPNSLGPVLAIVTTMVGNVIVAESTLTFLGVGLRTPSISWGLQLATAQSYFQTAPHLLLYPGLFLTLTVLSLITLGDILRDALDPKGRK